VPNQKEIAPISLSRTFSNLAEAVAHAAGRPWTFVMCVAIVLLWALSGPFFQFSETWQLVINTGTTIVTFLMVFLIQNTQNRDGAAIQTKLDELIRAGAAQNTFIGIEHLTEEELEVIRRRIETDTKQATDTVLEAVKEKAARAADRATGLE
jgi:low affinity Fe/Cu permease